MAGHSGLYCFLLARTRIPSAVQRSLAQRHRNQTRSVRAFAPALSFNHGSLHHTPTPVAGGGPSLLLCALSRRFQTCVSVRSCAPYANFPKLALRSRSVVTVLDDVHIVAVRGHRHIVACLSHVVAV